MSDLLRDFNAEKKRVDEEWAKTEKAETDPTGDPDGQKQGVLKCAVWPSSTSRDCAVCAEVHQRTRQVSMEAASLQQAARRMTMSCKRCKTERSKT